MPLQLKINPNRMEVLRLRRRLALAQRGHDLLKNKQDELMRQFTRLIEEGKGIRMEVEEVLQQAHNRLLLARGRKPRDAFAGDVNFSSQRWQLEIEEKRIMNLRIPHFKVHQEGSSHAYGLVSTNEDMDQAISLYTRAVPLMVRLAEKEQAVRLLAAEIEQTRRRVNALEYILIPSLRDTIKSIAMKLGEIERENVTRLMKIKEMVGAR